MIIIIIIIISSSSSSSSSIVVVVVAVVVKLLLLPWLLYAPFSHLSHSFAFPVLWQSELPIEIVDLWSCTAYVLSFCNFTFIFTVQDM